MNVAMNRGCVAISLKKKKQKINEERVRSIPNYSYSLPSFFRFFAGEVHRTDSKLVMESPVNGILRTDT